MTSFRPFRLVHEEDENNVQYTVENDIIDDISDDELYYQIRSIFNYEYEFLNSDKENKKYYIGSHIVIKSADSSLNDPYDMLLNCCVSPSIFFEYSLWTVKTYLYEFSIIYKNTHLLNNNIEIMQLFINEEDGTYNVILKTVWLKIFQRKWRKWNEEKKKIIRQRSKLSSLFYFEINGRWPVSS